MDLCSGAFYILDYPQHAGMKPPWCKGSLNTYCDRRHTTEEGACLRGLRVWLRGSTRSAFAWCWMLDVGLQGGAGGLAVIFACTFVSSYIALTGEVGNWFLDRRTSGCTCQLGSYNMEVSARSKIARHPAPNPKFCFFWVLNERVFSPLQFGQPRQRVHPSGSFSLRFFY